MLGAPPVIMAVIEIVNCGQVGVSVLVLVKQRLPGGFLAQGRFVCLDHGC